MPDTTVDPASVEALQARRAARQNRLRKEEAERAVRRELVTPEGAVLNLKLGTAAARAGSFLIDFLIFWAFVICFLMFYAWLQERTFWSVDDGDNIAWALFLVSWFVLRNFYWIFFEAGRRAATPGKRILGLRVVSRDGGNLTIGAILARNFSREIEVFLPMTVFFSLASTQSDIGGFINLAIFVWCVCFLFFPVFNKDNLRLGDIVAGTWVIQAPKTKLLKDVTSSRDRDFKGQGEITPHFAFTARHLDVYGIHELQTLEIVLRKKKQGPTVPKVAEKIREKIGWNAAPGEDDSEFLEAYYTALRGYLEQKLLLGKRKEDKFDQ